MDETIKVGDLVVFNPDNLRLLIKSSALIDKNGQTAFVLSTFKNSCLISFEPAGSALVSNDILKKIEQEKNIVDAWFDSHYN